MLIENTTPGVTALVNTGQVARSIDRQPTSTAFLVGYSPWGPVGSPVTITSWLDYVRKFGGFNANSYLDVAVYGFFNFFGGTQAVISRVVGATPVLATKTLLDRAGSPVATLRVDAKYPSTSVDIKVTVEAGTNANSVKLTFASVLLNVTEVFDNVTLATASLADINQNSVLVNITNLASATAAPNNLPAIAAASALTSGSDDFAGITTTQYVNGLGCFANSNLGTGQVAVPGQTDSSIYAALKTHAETFQRLAIIDPALGNDVSEMLAVDTTTYRSSYVALYYPWVKMLDLKGSNLMKFYPPSIFAVGACAQMDRQFGTEKAPANVTVPNALDVECNTDGSPLFTDSARASLNAKQINVIAPIQNEGIKIYGARVLYPAGETRVKFVHERRMLNLIFYSAKLGFSWAVFAKVDGQGRLFRDLKSSASNFLRQMWREGGLFGATEQEAFLVVADSTNNPPEELEQGRVHVQLGVKLSPTAEMIVVNIDNVPLSQDLNVLNGGSN
jgi:phage tail sheath protein FI